MTAKRKPGRPSGCTDELVFEICRRIAEGESLRKVCLDETMPAKSTVMGWLLDGKHKEFSDQYTRARDLQADKLFEEALEIADANEDDWIKTEGGRKVDHEDAMIEIIAGRPVSCELDGTKTHDRIVGICTIAGRDVVAELVSRGLARDCPRFSGGRYKELEVPGAERLPLPGYCSP